MPVENETILKKMKLELSLAEEQQHNQAKLKKHIAHVKLLCDLFLEEEMDHVSNKGSEQEFSQAELKAMIGEETTIKKFQQEQNADKERLYHEGANGSSIFDF